MSAAERCLSLALAVLFLGGFYLQADLWLSPAVKVPAVGALASGFAMLALYVGRLRHGDLVYFGLWLGIAGASLVLNPALWDWSFLKHYGDDYRTSFLVFLARLTR